MKKNVTKLFAICVIISIICPFIVYGKNENPMKGDLKCSEISKSRKICDEVLDSFGHVQEVRLKEEKDGIIVTKTVKKNGIGKYTVTFDVEGGQTVQVSSSDSIYIYFLFDSSDSIGKKTFDAAKNAIKQFKKNFDNDAENKNYNVYFSLSQFGGLYNDSLAQANYIPFNDDTKFKEYSEMGNKSYIQFALKSAYNELKNPKHPVASNLTDEQRKNLKKYVIVFGDGRYWYRLDTCWNEKLCTKKGSDGNYYNPKNSPYAEEYVNLIFGLENTKSFGIRYVGTNPNKKVSNKDSSSLCKNKTNNECDIIFMNKVVSGGRVETITKDNTIEMAFNKIFNEIISQNQEKKETLNTRVIDTIGKEFSSSNTGKTKTMDFDNNHTVESFNIKIDTSVETGWHRTNEGFTVKYGNGLEKSFFVNKDNQPEVYWKKENREWRYCSDSSVTSDNDMEINDYYQIICEEGWDNNEGYHADLMINNIPINANKTSFAIQNGVGFPIRINLESHVRCFYEFNTNKYVSDRNSLSAQLSKTSDPKEVKSFEKKILLLDDVLKNYKDKLNGLNKYADKFKNQEALLHIKYKNSGTTDLNFINNNDFTIYDNDCQNTKEENIYGEKIITNRVCTLGVRKSMQLPLRCLSMKDGTAEECNLESNNQINGGNNFYVPFDKKSGYISVTLKGATYYEKDIKLEGESLNESGNPRCSFTNDTSIKNKVLFRQIELSDPFIQTYTNKTRKIGSNWLNANYNFINIIKDDIWFDSNKENYQYRFDISKEDVNNIKKNTAEVGVNSYLGRDCHFGSNNNYICDFIKSNKYFTKVY